MRVIVSASIELLGEASSAWLEDIFKADAEALFPIFSAIDKTDHARCNACVT
jgi:hypothetical protein